MSDNWVCHENGVPYEDSPASGISYGGLLIDKFEGCLVLAEKTIEDYQGGTEFLILTREGVQLCGWTYGSCEGCDPWMNNDEISDEQKIYEMLGPIYSDPDHLDKHVKMLEETEKTMKYANNSDKIAAFKHAAKMLRERKS